MEVTRKQLRDQTLERFKYIRTCVLARELCLLIRTNRVAMEKKDVQDCCEFVSKLCNEAGCTEQSDLCRKAVEALSTSEEKYLDLCRQSCIKCGESRQPIAKKSAYVA
ncbi:MAG: hypothetical protein QXX08_11205 [Candidatus Bathyarchaeia archaeon]